MFGLSSKLILKKKTFKSLLRYNNKRLYSTLKNLSSSKNKNMYLSSSLYNKKSLNILLHTSKHNYIRSSSLNNNFKNINNNLNFFNNNKFIFKKSYLPYYNNLIKFVSSRTNKSGKKFRKNSEKIP